MIRRLLYAGVLIASIATLAISASMQGDVTDADLERVNNGRVVAIGLLSGDRSIARLPLETYVARVLTGEAEQNAPDAELEALAIAIRTYATFNAGRHRRDGFDLCDTTHCQVLRAATAATRRAALATAGQILTWRGAPAEIFYSANCGGRSESAVALWPGSDLPYLTSVKDDVHDDDVPWTLALELADLRAWLGQRGFRGDRLKDVRVAARTVSGRVATLHLDGLEPNVIAGDQFRLMVGAGSFKSTAFSVEKHGSRLEFTGRGYGHGVGMCVVGAGRRARRGETVRQILAQYYPGLAITPLDSLSWRLKPDTLLATNPPVPTPSVPARSSAAVAPAASVPAPPKTAIVIRGTAAGADLQQLAARAQDGIARTLGVRAIPITIDVHDTVESFRQATGKPWWVSASVMGGTVDVAPPALLAQRDGVEMTLRNAIAQAMVAGEYNGRPEWVRVGAGLYFSRAMPPAPPAAKTKLKCPADAELTLAISAAAQREAESRAEACFARALSASRDWRSIR